MQRNIGASGIHDQSSGIGTANDEAFARMDLLSQILTLIRLTGDFVYAAELSAPWGVSYPAGSSHFHIVRDGTLWVAANEQPPIEVLQGDLLLLPHGKGHTLSSQANGPSVSFSQIRAEHAVDQLRAFRLGEQGDITHLVSGTFSLTGPLLAPLMTALPQVIHIRCDSGNVPDWLQAMTHFLLAETEESMPGSSLMISRIIDLLVIRTIRTWADAHVSANGWVGALADARMGRVLTAIHANPGKDWSLAELSSVAGMSRSVFAERFAAMVGEPPHRYLTRWRMTLARGLLESGSANVGEAARKVGYASEAGFSRAFKATFGYPPNEARRP